MNTTYNSTAIHLQLPESFTAHCAHFLFRDLLSFIIIITLKMNVSLSPETEGEINLYLCQEVFISRTDLKLLTGTNEALFFCLGMDAIAPPNGHLDFNCVPTPYLEFIPFLY